VRGNLTSNPLMVNFNPNPGMPIMSGGKVIWPNNVDYHLQSGSPASNMGTTSCAPTVSGCTPSTDFDGVTRSGTMDIGSYNF
jgi:hypothetical protein